MGREKHLNSKSAFLSPLKYLVTGVCLVTLFVNTNSIDPFNTPKLAALILVASISINSLIKFWKICNLRDSKTNLLFILLLIFFLSSGVVSVIFADNLYVAIIGETQRRNGFLAYLALTFVALTISRLITFANSINFFKISILTGVIFSFYGIIQMSGNDPISWNNPYNAVIATVGNPNFASALMAVFTTLSFSTFFIRNISIAYKVFASTCITLSVTAIVASNSRQGLVSLGFALAFFTSVYLYLLKKKLGLVAIIISLVSSLLAVAGMLQKGPLTELLYKPSVSVRGFYWEAAIEMLKSFPVTGVGFDHYGYYFKELRSVEYPLRVGFDLTSTNAHNTFLQMFATGGVLLGLSYLLLVIFTLVIGLRLLRNSDSAERIITLGLLAAWLAFQAQSVISIDNIGISVWGWILTGAIFGLAINKECKSMDIDLSKGLVKNKNQIRVLPFLITGIVLIPAVILSVLLMRVEKNALLARNILDNYSNQADKNSATSQQLLKMLNQHTSYVLKNKFSDPNYKVQIVYDLFNSGAQKESFEIAKELALDNPRNLYAQDAVALLSHELNDFVSEIQARTKIAELDPWNAKNYLQMLVLYKGAGDMVNAKFMSDKIQSFASNTPEAKFAIEELSK